jgi:outer membrane protein TolC
MKRLAVFLLLAAAGRAQPLTLSEAVRRAAEKYPAVRVSLEQVSAAAASINLARTAYLPRSDFLAQLNRATHNNIFGMTLQPTLLSPISGPVLRTNSLDSVWGSAVGVLVTWEPFDFGLRKAGVREAESARSLAEAQVEVTRLQVETAAADAFLTLLAGQQTVIAGRAALERARVLDHVVEALVKNELRPGADASRSQAEMALAQTQLIQAEQAVDVAKAALSQLLGVPASGIQVAPGPLLEIPPEHPAEAALAPDRHPLAVAQTRAIEQVKARERALERSYYPKFLLQGTAYARGTGIQADGTTGGAASGLGPNIQNWGVGMSVTFPAFDLPGIRVRRQIEASNERAEAARYQQLLQDLNGQLEKSQATLAGARRIAQNTPVQLAAARVSQTQAAARYQSGLATIIEVAEAQRLLAQAEIDDGLARLAVWRALLGVAAAQGDLAEVLRSSAR